MNNKHEVECSVLLIFTVVGGSRIKHIKQSKSSLTAGVSRTVEWEICIVFTRLKEGP